MHVCKVIFCWGKKRIRQQISNYKTHVYISNKFVCLEPIYAYEWIFMDKMWISISFLYVRVLVLKSHRKKFYQIILFWNLEIIYTRESLKENNKNKNEKWERYGQGFRGCAVGGFELEQMVVGSVQARWLQVAHADSVQLYTENPQRPRYYRMCQNWIWWDFYYR